MTADPDLRSAADPDLRRAVARAVAWALVLVGPAAALFGVKGALAALLAAVVLGGPGAWLEARWGPHPGEPLPHDVRLWAAHLALTLLLVAQAHYLHLLLERGPGLALTGSLQATPDWPLTVSCLALGIGAATSAVRRVQGDDIVRVGMALVVFSLATLFLAGCLFMGWLVAELAAGLGSVLERAWLRRQAGPEALVGVPRDRWWLLAYLGHPAAQAQLGGEAPRPSAHLGPWLRGLELAGTEPLGRAAAAIARRALRGAPHDPSWAPAHAALSAWVADPSPVRAQAVVAALEALPVEVSVLGPAERALRRYATILRRDRWGRGSALADAAVDLGDPEQVRQEVTGELLTWALEPRQAAEGTPPGPRA